MGKSKEKDESIVIEIEEGEISDDSEAIQEISEEDFKPKGLMKPCNVNGGRESRDWRSYYNYSGSSNFGSNLHNFAWFQAVQNKPLNFANDSSEQGQVCNVISDDSSENGEKEEGELEEGEIDLDAEVVKGSEEEHSRSHNLPVDDCEFKESLFEERIQLILEALETITVIEIEKSFHGACSQLHSLLEKLQLVIMESGASAVDALVQQSFDAIQTVNSVFSSMNTKRQEQTKQVFMRLLVHVKNQNLGIFHAEQMQEIEAIVLSLNLQPVKSSVKEEEKETHDTGVKSYEIDISGGSTSEVLKNSEKVLLDPISVKSGNQYTSSMGLETLRPGYRSKGCFGPLLDLHMDHDADSLPSPTRAVPPPLPKQKPPVETLHPYNIDSIPSIQENPQPLTKHKPQVEKDGSVDAGIVTTSTLSDNTNDATVLFYDADAHKAVTSYQKKFGGTSFFLSDRLPSPTPSEECDEGDDGSKGEVSSSSIADTAMTVCSDIPSQPDASVIAHVYKPTGQLASEFRTVVRTAAKSRDPRLRFAKPEMCTLDFNERPLLADTLKNEPREGVYSSRKHKSDVESALDGHTLKKQRNELINPHVSRDVQMLLSGSGRWLDDTNRKQLADNTAENTGMNLGKSENGQTISCQKQDTVNVKTCGDDQLPVTGNGPAVSLPSLLKDVIVNPTMLMQLIMEQQRLAVGVEKKSNDLFQSQAESRILASNLGTRPGTTPLLNIAASKSSENEQKPTGKPQIPIQTTLMDSQGEGGKIRMKPRDPRRILHNSTIQKNESLGTEQIGINAPPSSIMQFIEGNIAVRQLGEQAQTSSMPSQPGPPPDIARQFTNNLQNLANILSSSQPANTSMGPENISSQSIAVNVETGDGGVEATDSKDMKCEGGMLGSSPLPTTWDDVEHLFEGYDDKEKAAIQRERTKRIEEQNRMFAARKLCLVLDLDHTLLNSAKFVEVDRVHEEILRKKEELDREKPQRHLFRFPHMSMWTKLRPGIWTFLEKASKLYELHLYTMGNNVYAKEMAKVLDPTGVLFAGRVISKGDEGDLVDGDEKPKSKDLEGVLGMESSVVIIDDSIRVWPHNKLNLIVVERYTYFPCSRRQFGLLGPSLLEIDHDERPEDGTIASSLAVIERIHENFFSNPSLRDMDVRNILSLEQKKILAGCHIVFSRIFPLGGANHLLHPLWQTAEQFGAVCTTQIDEQVTHVVANSLGTDKVNWALATGRYVVHPGWVEASALLYRRANELDFAVKP